VFWSLSLAEWRAIAVPRRAPSLGRSAFDALMQTYPDEFHAQ
jgi:hypothetical protein